MIWGSCSSMYATLRSIWCSFSVKSALSLSPSAILAALNFSVQALTTDSISAHSSSSSVSGSLTVMTSGKRAISVILTCPSIPSSLLIELQASIYCLASAVFRTTSPAPSANVSSEIKTSTFPLDTYSFRTFLICASNALNFLGMRMLTSR